MRPLSLGMRFVLAAGFLGLAGCASVPPPDPKLSANPHLAAKLCPAWRLVGLREPDPTDLGTCPDLGDPAWKGEFLFGAHPKPSRLREFCLYTYQGDGLPNSLPTLPKTGLIKLDPDCPVLLPAGPFDDLSGLTAELLHERFLQQVGRAGVTLSPPQAPVRLSFIDTQPTGVGAPSVEAKGNSLHGYTLAHIGRELLSLDDPLRPGSQPSCNGTDRLCAAQVVTQLALAYGSFDARTGKRPVRPHQGGGFIGTVSELAVAIHDELWRPSMTPAPIECPECRLVLNLSVAWDGRFGGLSGEPKDFPASVNAVYKILQEAASNNVLVIAAAGNRRACPVRGTGPLLPAAWEERKADSNPARPLLYAVGGIQADDLEIANARPGGMPPRAAYADHAVVTDLEGQPLPPMTGTSVATAVVSSIAAAVWSQDPSLKPEEVMSRLVPDPPLTYQADFPAPAQPVHRVLLCPALPGPRRCPSIADDHFAAKVKTALGHYKATVKVGGGTSQTVQGGSVPRCFEDGWVRTQPEDNPCLSCALTGGPPPSAPYPQIGTALTANPSGLAAGTCTLWIEIDNDTIWHGGCVTPKKLEFPGISEPITITPTSCLNPGETKPIALSCPDLPAEFVATLTFEDVNGTKWLSPVLVP